MQKHKSTPLRLLSSTIAYLALMPSTYVCGDPSSEELIHSLEPTTISSEKIDTLSDQVGSIYTIITQKELDSRKSTFAIDALRRVPGVYVRRVGGPGGNTTVSVRGFQNEQTLIMIDGVEINDSSQTAGSFNFSALPVDNIDRIEVSRGPQSTIHGSDAMAGSINIITKKGDSEPAIGGGIEVGANATRRAHVYARGSKGKWSFATYFSHYQSNEFSSRSPESSEADDYENKTYQARIEYAVHDWLSFYFSAYIQDSVADFDSFGNPNDSSVFLKTRQTVAEWGAEFYAFDEKLKSKPSISLTNTRNNTFGANRSLLEGKSHNFEWDNQYVATDWLTVAGGADYQIDSARDPFSPFDKGRDSRSAYIEGRTQFSDRLYVNMGARIDDNSDFGTESTFRTTANYHLKETQSRIHTSFGNAYRAPTLGEQFGTFGGFANPAPNLLAERSDGFDIGLEQTLWQKRARIDISYFYNDIKDQIEFSFPGGFGAPGQFTNTDAARTQGYEISATLIPHPELQLQGQYTWLDTLDRSSGLNLARQPHSLASAEAMWKPSDRLDLNLRTFYVGKRFDGNNETTPMSSHIVWDTTLTVEISEKIEAYLRIHNLFDKDYESINGFSTADRSAFVGINLKL